jgi:hypothetical protein
MRYLVFAGLGILLTAQFLEGQGRGRPAGPPGGGARMSPPRQAQAQRPAPPAPKRNPAAARPAQERRDAAGARRPQAPRSGEVRGGPNRALPRDFDRHPGVATRVRPMLPNGINVHDAAAGFKNTGQFVAATNVSRNLGIPFEELKARMMAGESLGQAIQSSRPGMSRGESRRHARDAERRAKEDLRDWSRNRPQRESVEGATSQPDS